jgi:hypothetical protein
MLLQDVLPVLNLPKPLKFLETKSEDGIERFPRVDEVHMYG